MEEPGQRLVVRAGPLRHPERAREKPGHLEDPHQSELQGGQALRVAVRRRPLPPEEADSVRGLHAHQGTLLLKITIPGVRFRRAATGSLLRNLFFFFLGCS